MHECTLHQIRKLIAVFYHTTRRYCTKTKIGYEINFNRYFYKYTPPRPLDVIEGELKGIEKEIAEMLGEMV